MTTNFSVRKRKNTELNALNLCICVDINFEKIYLEKGQPKNIPVHVQLLKNTIYLAKRLDFVLFCLKFCTEKIIKSMREE